MLPSAPMISSPPTYLSFSPLNFHCYPFPSSRDCLPPTWPCKPNALLATDQRLFENLHSTKRKGSLPLCFQITQIIWHLKRIVGTKRLLNSFCAFFCKWSYETMRSVRNELGSIVKILPAGWTSCLDGSVVWNITERAGGCYLSPIIGETRKRHASC